MPCKLWTNIMTVGTPVRATSAASCSGPEGRRWTAAPVSVMASSQRASSSGWKGTGAMFQMRSHSTVQPPAWAKRSLALPRFPEHVGEGRGVEVALVEREAAFRDDAGDDAGLGRAGADRADATVAVRDAVNLGSHLRGGEKGVAAAVHRRAAGVRGLAVEGHGVPLDAERAEHGAERAVEVQQDGALLDVEFQVGGGVDEFAVGILDGCQVDPVLAQGVGQADAVAVAEQAGLVQIEVARTGGASEQALAEARAFLVGPVDESDGDRRVAAVLRVDAAEDFDPGENVEAAVEPAAVGHGIQVAADEQSALGVAAQGGPEVARRVGVDFHGERGQGGAQVSAGGGPRRGEGDPLRAVFVAGQGMQFFEFGNGAGRGEEVGHAGWKSRAGSRLD